MAKGFIHTVYKDEKWINLVGGLDPGRCHLSVGSDGVVLGKRGGRRAVYGSSGVLVQFARPREPRAVGGRERVGQVVEGVDALEGVVPGRRRRVLLVDDDAALRLLYRFNLEASGVEVVEVADGESALAWLAAELPDVVLLDVMMPGLDGWTVAARLAADLRMRNLPVIFITAVADDAARARGLALGAIGYLVKPFNPVTLADEIEKLLRDRDVRG
jgi:CheY-like chemotaxis protein